MKSTGNAVPTAAVDNDWQADSDLRALIEAEKVKSDPARMKAAMKKHAEMKKAVDAIKKG